jgi:cytochrome c-type biogenesis protein CcmE
MLNIKTKIRLSVFTALLVLTIAVVVLVLKTLEDNIMYFYSPSEVKESSNIILNNNIRIGGMVKDGSVKADEKEIKFIVTDYKNEIIVSYKGTVPALFAEGKGVVAEGKLQDKKFFLAKRILAKHDENYMPPEIKESLNNNAK